MLDFNKNDFINNFNPFKRTAIVRHTFSRPMRELLNRGLLDNSTVLDYGTGRGTDCKFLEYSYQCNNIDAYGYDEYNEEYSGIYVFKRFYTNLTSIYMMNTVYSLETHKRLVDSFGKLAKNVYIAVRTDISSVKDTWRYIEEYDGYITPNGSFQRFYTEEMITKYFGKVTYIKSTTGYKLFKLED
ncbi:methyltransferase domain-containing protein [Clostridium tagluense]|uniref:Methyltransferase n=1 Tax=Clostridium tagluense TaxID=360422 RepID=A0A401ULK0_9CLOT|nr:methyltransferase domain-containing protein [Clostridium tagluense]GCD10405.1 hypothetical protein Ctaglu_20280 [Clostridium tagluense]